MKIQMLHTVLHDGERIPADEIVTGLPEAAAQALVASGAAKAVDESKAAPEEPEPKAPEAALAAPAGNGDVAPAAETAKAKAGK